MRSWIQKSIKSERGQAMVEFAMTLPILVAIVGMIISGGQFIYVKQALQQAAYEGARVGVTMPDASQARTAANKAIHDFLAHHPFVKVDQVVVTAKPTSGWSKGKPFEVTVSYDMKSLFPIPGTSLGVGKTKTVKGNVQLAIERGS